MPNVHRRVETRSVLAHAPRSTRWQFWAFFTTLASMAHFLYQLIPPRTTFATDMTATEGDVMAQHGAYWQGQLERGKVVVFGPVSDPAGPWGLGVLDVDDRDEAMALVHADPAITSGLATYAIHPMDAVVRT
jgi:uncharacterized protein